MSILIALMLVFGLPFAIPAGRVAEKKTGGGQLWTFLTIVFGPFALVIVLLMPYDPLWQEQRRAKEAKR